MLRTQEAASFNFGQDGMTGLCEAICLDAIEVTSVTRVSIWFFDESGDMVCRRLLDSRDGRFQDGAVIPRSATAAYLDAAQQGLASMQTENAPELPSDSAEARDKIQARIDLLLVDAKNNPAAIFRCERWDSGADWRPRDITLLRNLAQTLATAIRRNTLPAVPAMPSIALSGMGSTPQDLSWLRHKDETAIWLQALAADTAFDALAFDALPPGTDALLDDPFADLDDDIL
ncbi:hypothetical protein [Ferrovibrio sp.]|uniref:hypothetical protein n=1 Tax=Ferrovibrio sp. TaxID=1917215 RepID=UPI000CB1820F|nr:hypothetical protein [Ferrovibrio sp.]PJI39441.1 MAG: hypothetical protein CTR53_12820 [Ferrovibrio sp.]